MKIPSRAIPSDVVEVLRASRCEGDKLYLPGTLDRKLYARTNEVLASIGGVWKIGKVKAHVFPGNATDALSAALDAGAFSTDKDLNFYATPVDLAARMVKLAGVKPGDKVLEPSAGGAAIARPLRDAGATVFCVEFDEKRAKALCEAGFDAVQADFLSIVPGTIGPFDAIVMNPPFAFPGQAKADIDHVEHAIKFLKPDGILVSVMAGGIASRDDYRTTLFREKIEEYGSLEVLPHETFKASGTSFGTVLVTYRAE